MARLTNPYSNINGDTLYFDYASLIEIETLSAGLDQAEVLAWYGLDVQDLDQPDAILDKKYFNIAFNRGRAVAKQKAVFALFEAMKGRQGKESSISYLARFGTDQWRQDVQSDNSTSGKFSFKVEMD